MSANGIGPALHWSDSNDMEYLLQYLGEEGSSCMLEAVVVCSNPWNLEAGSLSLQRSWLGLHVYSRAMAANMKTLFEK